MNRKILAAGAVLVVLAAASALTLLHDGTQAQDVGTVKERYTDVKSQTLTYMDGETECEAFVAWDGNVKGRRPAVLVVHDWKGRGAFDEQRARELAALGYIGFSVDVYGKSVRPQTTDEARKATATWYGDRAALRTRLQAALTAAQEHELVDRLRIAAIGYCFGGSCVLELARSGAEIAGVVSFHGGLGTSMPAKAGEIKARVLILHGADDPNVGADQVSALWKEMTEAGADWQLVAYGNAVHSFTNPAAGNDNSKGAAYNEKADKRSWEAMKDFFREALAS
ncbi:MAG: dienelactone hydrolase family protein [Planctomycetes bacterium]|nr:dienelactone hydrolase family protein [Planctomycetota bacterium]